MTTFHEWLNAHPRSTGIAALLVLLALAFAAGRYTVPTKVVTVTLKQHEEKTTVAKVEAQKDVHKAEDTKTVAKTVIVYKDRYVHPDGSTEEHEVSQTVNEAQQVHLDLTAAASLAAANIEHVTTDTTYTAKTVEAEKPQWLVHTMVGVKLDAPLTPVYGLGVERRVVGPIFGGAWGISNGTLGLSVSGEF